MKKWIQRTLLVVGSAALLAGTAALAGLGLAHHRMNRSVDVPAAAVAYVDDPAAMARGRYLFASRGCEDCHGADGAGRVFLDTPDGLHVRGANITRGENSAVARYEPQDWDRAVRHGVSREGRPLLIMPSEEYNRFTDADLAALVAYVRSLPARAGQPARVELPPVARLAYGFGLLRDAAAKIDHLMPPEPPVPEAVSVAYGRYVANMCLGCHGPQLQGGRIPGAPPDWPAAPSLAPGSESALHRYPDAASLARMFRSGRRPDGTAIRVMPFEALRQMNDTDVSALHLFLRTPADAMP